ncbi:hypothetical protein G9A89_012624 [Geosiphon pyriformis]|nr:hypothetical protein G9A89_012624 [Geosiphon pyriformis]
MEKKEVVIKIIKNSEEVYKEFNIQTAMFINNRSHVANITFIYRITQNTETLEYGVVMEFALYGDMRKYLSTNFHPTNWSSKLLCAWNIALGLESIHSSGMIHCDLHSGNILQYSSMCVSIGDLGLCQPTINEVTTVTTVATKEKKIYGVIPYIPPEVLRGEKFTESGDIYSFAMSLWELATGNPPFYDLPHDHLIMDILNGKRPEITFPLIPPCIAETIEKCWYANPENRPTAKEVRKTLWDLREMYLGFNRETKDEIFIGKVSKPEIPEMEQFLKSEKYVKEIEKNDSIKNDLMTTKISRVITSIHPGAIYTSRLLTAQKVNFSTGLFT